MKSKVVFKTYDKSQLNLLPPSYDDLVPSNHPVRIVNTIIDQIDIADLERSYKGGGTSSYHPRMLLKVIIYAYLRNMYSSRKIEQALLENIHFMWLARNLLLSEEGIAQRKRRCWDVERSLWKYQAKYGL